MLKKTITSTDYNGVTTTEDYYFNLTEAELMEMELSTEGGITEMISRIVAAKNTPQIIKIFKDFILKAYGEKSQDGKRFVKIDKDGHRLADDFAQTEAYSKLFMELAMDDKAGANFVIGVMPDTVKPKIDQKAIMDEVAKLGQ